MYPYLLPDAVVNGVVFSPFPLWRLSNGDEDIVPHSERAINIAVVNLLLVLACPEVSVMMKKLKLPSRFNPVKKTFLEKYIVTPRTDVEVIFICFSMVSKCFQCVPFYIGCCRNLRRG